MHKRKDIIALLLYSPHAKDIDVLAIQEPWLNTFSPATYCPSSCPFTPVFSSISRRSCLLINKKLDINSWEPKTRNKDLCSITLQTQQGVIWIHSIYSQPPGSFSTAATDYNNPIEALAQLLEDNSSSQHLIVGDFNLHHPAWSGNHLPSAHTASEGLLEALYERGDCQLITPPGTITFPTSTGGTTIDLSFATNQLANRVLECQINPLFDHGSDHQPVLTRLQLAATTATPKRRRC
jgi:exonuclease III